MPNNDIYATMVLGFYLKGKEGSPSDVIAVSFKDNGSVPTELKDIPLTKNRDTGNFVLWLPCGVNLILDEDNVVVGWYAPNMD